MAYMRGENYIWDEDAQTHFWVADGYDGWDLADWAVDEDEKRHPERIDASGVGVPNDVVDEFVVMRLAKLLEVGKLTETIDRMLAPDYPRGGNVGMQRVHRHAAAIRRTLQALQEGSAQM